MSYLGDLIKDSWVGTENSVFVIWKKTWLQKCHLSINPSQLAVHVWDVMWSKYPNTILSPYEPHETIITILLWEYKKGHDTRYMVLKQKQKSTNCLFVHRKSSDKEIVLDSLFNVMCSCCLRDAKCHVVHVHCVRLKQAKSNVFDWDVLTFLTWCYWGNFNLAISLLSL